MKVITLSFVMSLLSPAAGNYFDQWVTSHFGGHSTVPTRALKDSGITCPAADDPNDISALRDYSYDFLFADGSRVFGTSDQNTVEVSVAGKKFELHISCSDTFDGGYGTKGGPKAGINPKVVAWKVWKYKDGNNPDKCQMDKTCGPGGTGETPRHPACFVPPRCTDIEDPNTVAKKQTYEFFFADGTYIIGASNDNTVTRTVAGKSVELHISCSDDYYGGYGQKSGPTQGVNPKVLWFQIWKYKDSDKGDSACSLEKTCYGP
jgi:hypothetical protein